MATLTVLNKGISHAGRLGPCILIGRKPFNHVALNHPTVSRLHAWILQQADGYLLSSAGGRNPTRLNGQVLTEAQLLSDGDVITIGPARLIFRATDTATADRHWETLPPLPAIHEDGLLFRCSCGAPAWIHHKLQHATLRCRHCHAILKSPDPKVGGSSSAGHAAGLSLAPVAAPKPIHPHNPLAGTETPSFLAARSAVASTRVAPSLVTSRTAAAKSRSSTTSSPSEQAIGMEVVCSVCQSPLLAGESITECPECGLTFHAECWQENMGCSAYGCRQVGILDPETQAHASTEVDAETQAAEAAIMAAHEQPRIPWEFLLLALSLLALAIAAPTFGIPSLIVGIKAIHYLHQRPDCHKWTIVLCVVLSGVGFLGGAPAAWLWWYHINLTL